MKVHICDLCESIIKNRTDRKIIKIKKTEVEVDCLGVFTEQHFYTQKHTLCPLCFNHMIEFIENMRKVDKEILMKSTKEDKSNEQ